MNMCIERRRAAAADALAPEQLAIHRLGLVPRASAVPVGAEVEIR